MNHQTNLSRKTFNVNTKNYNKSKPSCHIELSGPSKKKAIKKK